MSTPLPDEAIISDLRDANTEERMADRPPAEETDLGPMTAALDDVAPESNGVSAVDDV